MGGGLPGRFLTVLLCISDFFGGGMEATQIGAARIGSCQTKAGLVVVFVQLQCFPYLWYLLNNMHFCMCEIIFVFVQSR